MDEGREERGGANEGVVIVTEETMKLPEEDQELKEYRLRMLALLPAESTVPKVAVQQDLDANFDAFMEAEYADD